MKAATHKIVSEDTRRPYEKHWRTVTLSCGHKGIIHNQWKVGDMVPCVSGCVIDLSEFPSSIAEKFVHAPCGCWHYMAGDPYEGTDYAGFTGNICKCGQHDRAGNPS